MIYIRKFFGFIIDFSLSLSFYCILNFCISAFYYLPFLWGWLSVWLVYNLVCHVSIGCTLGEKFFGFVLELSGSNKRRLIKVILRDISTSIPGFVLIIVLYVYNLSPYVRTLSNLWGGPVILIFFLFPVLLFSLMIFRKKVFKIQVIKTFYPVIKKEQIKWLSIYTIILIAGFLFRKVDIYLTNPLLKKDASAEYYIPRPSSIAVMKYIEYLQYNRQEVNDYIFDLFKKYDHVILCERMHQEYTQWDMIYDIVKDERFASIGTIFTEQGNVNRIKAFRSFVSTPYPNDSLVEKALSYFLIKNQTLFALWDRTSWFDFLKRIYYLNQNNKVRINVNFTNTDILVNPEAGSKYDSIMAANIKNIIYSQNVGKSLIIMNFRHAFLLSDYNDKNCGEYINDAFPGKVANVLINNVSFNYFSTNMALPIQNSKWDVAFEQITDSAYAFSFKDSPFGKDKFDLYPFFSTLCKKKYEDMFTGMIYYLPLRKHVFSIGYPYMLEGENENIFLNRSMHINKEVYELVKKYDLPMYKNCKRNYILNNDSIYFQINKLENNIVYYVFTLGFLVIVILFIVIVTNYVKDKVRVC